MARTLAAALLFVALLGVACSSGSKPAQQPKISSVAAQRDVVDGKAQLTSTLTVKFDRSLKLADTNLPFASLFELKVPLADGSSKRVLIQTAARSDTNDRLVTLTVDDLIPEGATLYVQRKAFDTRASGTISGTVESALDPAVVVLASQAMAVSNPDFFAASVIAPESAADDDVATQRAALEAHMKLRPNANDDATKQALGLFDAIPTTMVPSPKLRAAIAGLSGTFAEPAIESLLTNNNCTNKPAAKVAFQPPPDEPELLARVTFENGARVVSVNPFAKGERFEHLIPVIAHEAIHCDSEAGIVEEIAATAFDSFLYLQLVAVDPTLAETNTKVSRELNVDAIAMINSGQRFPESVGVLKSPGVELALPNTNSPAASFADLVALAYRGIPLTPSPAENVALNYAQLLSEAVNITLEDPFDLDYLDELLSRAMDPGVFANAIVVFELVPAG